MPLILWALLHPINDVTTTLQAPPALTRPYPAEFKEIQQKLYPDLKPFESTMSPQDLFKRAEEIARSMPDWQIIENDNLRLTAVATTAVLRFKDDIAIEVRPESGGGSSLHMRSRSRVGKSDLGANFKRIQAFLARLK